MTDVRADEELDVQARIEQLSLLRDGWLDGDGLAPARTGLAWFASAWQSHWPSELPPPHLYPAPSGGLEAEWTVGETSLSAGIDLSARRAVLMMVNTRSGDIAIDQSIDLALNQGWHTLTECLRTAIASQ